MTFACFANTNVDMAIERFARSEAMTLVVGAGASMEARLPSWSELVRRLLTRAGVDRHLLPAADGAALDEWVEHTLRRDSVLGAAAAVEVMSEMDLADWLRDALFADGPDVQPGPIARQVAELKRTLADRLAVVTTNYDDLLEAAMRAAGVDAYPRVQDPQSSTGEEVVHLHGYVARRDGIQGDLVLSEESYHVMQLAGSWQERFMRTRLEATDVLFVGASLSDPNLVRYLFGAARHHRHAAVFVRQAEPGLGDTARAARERVTAVRWRRVNVDALFLDDFADVAQFIHEIGRRRGDHQRYVGVYRRCSDRLAWLEADLGGDGFAEVQAELEAVLGEALDRALAEAHCVVDGERVGLALWLADPGGTRLIRWAKSWGRYPSREALEAVEVSDEHNAWAAVRAFRSGTVYEHELRESDSPWRFVRALPVAPESERDGRLPIGVLTLTTDRPSAESALGRLAGGDERRLHTELATSVEALVG